MNFDVKSIFRYGLYLALGMVAGIAARTAYDAGLFDRAEPGDARVVAATQNNSPKAKIRPVEEVDVYVPPSERPPEEAPPDANTSHPAESSPTESSSAGAAPSPPPPTSPSGPLPVRRLKPFPAVSQKLSALAAKLDMPGTDVRTACRRYVGTVCIEGALDAFFAALDRAQAGQGRARVVVMGNSLIASDRIVNIWREHFVHQFGDAGRGFLLTDRMAEYGPRYRTAKWASGFRTHNIAMGEFGRFPHGVAGVLHVSEKSRSRAIYPLDGETKATLFWHAHKKSPPIDLLVDGERVARLSEGPTGFRQDTVTLAPGRKKLIVQTASNAVLYGVSLEKPGAGFILDTMGVPAVDGKIFLRSDEAAVKAQLTTMAPDLVTLFLGGNEIKRVAWGKSKREDIVPQTRALIARTRKVVPGASCLVVGPIENVRGKSASKPFQTRWQTPVVVRALEHAAHLEGCAFIDLYGAMGESGALRRLDRRNMLHDDLVHPKGNGLDLPGEIIAQSLLRAYVSAEGAGAAPHLASSTRPAALREAGAKAARVGHVRVQLAPDVDPAFAEGLTSHLAERFGRGGMPLQLLAEAPPKSTVNVPKRGDTAMLYYRADKGAAVSATPAIPSARIERVASGLYRMVWPRRSGPQRVAFAPRRGRSLALLGVATESVYGVDVVSALPGAGDGGPSPDVVLGAPGCRRGLSLPDGTATCFDGAAADAVQLAAETLFGG